MFVGLCMEKVGGEGGNRCNGASEEVYGRCNRTYKVRVGKGREGSEEGVG